MKKINERIEKLKKSAVRRTDLESQFYQAVEDLNVRELRFPLSPSAALKPMRDLYYALVNYFEPGKIAETPLRPQTLLTFEIGHNIETIMGRYTRHAFHVKYAKQRVVIGSVKRADGTFLQLGGELDDPIVVDKTLYLTDYKSANDFSFMQTPKEDNIAQMQLYMHSDWGRKNKVDKTILKYFNKDTSEVKYLEIGYDSELAAMLLARFQTIWDYFERKEIPPREFVLGVDWRADYSNFRDHDFAEFDKGIERQVVPPDLDDPIAPSEKERKDKATIRRHVLKYGSAIVEYPNGTSLYARITTTRYKGKDKQVLALVEEGQEKWEEVV